MGVDQLFKTLIIVSLFYSVSITAFVNVLPEDSLNYIDRFNDPAVSIDPNEITSQVQDTLGQQTDIPVIELGALVFYSGNLLIDLIINFLTALPQMLAMLIGGIFSILNVDTIVHWVIEVFAVAVVTVLYIIGLIELMIGIRSQSPGFT